MKCYIRLAIPPLKTIKQHATISKKYYMMFCEMLHSFVRGFMRACFFNTVKLIVFNTKIERINLRYL